MTLSHVTFSKATTHLAAFAGAVATSALLLFVAPQAHAAPAANYYQFELAQPAAQEKQLVRGVFVKCEGTACRAPIASSASKNMCISIARELGEVKSFQAGDRVFGAEQLASCNQKNKEAIARK